MKPKDLVKTHRYAEAVEAYRREIREQPDKNLYAAMGQAFLALRKFNEALESFRRDDEIEDSRLKGSFPSLIKVGATLWLMGKRQEAILEWHRAAAGILDGSIHYGDLAGGGTQGLLLWYGAVALNDKRERDYALEYLRTRAERKAYAICWPRPLVLMVLGEKSFAEVLEIGNGSPVLSVCLESAATDLLKRRHLCQTLFYAACQERQTGNEAECIKKMRLCSKLENPIIESEWYLARGECDQIDYNQ
jgi:tetratricopeptide (TPR) repeat protein